MTGAVRPLMRFVTIFAALAVGGGWPLQSVDQALAQSVSKPKPVDGRKTVISGIKAYEAGRMDQAVSTLSKAISGGGLSSQDLAKALYYRGLAHQKSNQSAQAIADLTSAVWMKGGLSPNEQQAALAARSKAYGAVGVSDPGPPGQSIGQPAPAAPPARSAPAPAQTAQVAAKPKATPTAPVQPKPGFQTQTKPKTAPKAAVQPSSGFQTQVKRSANTAPTASAEPAASSSNPLSGVGSFFSNIFSGGSTASAPQAPVSAPASSPVAVAPVPVAPVASTPRVAKVQTPPAVVAPVQPAAAKPKKPDASPPVTPFQTTLARAPTPPAATAPRRAAPTVRAAPPSVTLAAKQSAPAAPRAAPVKERTVAAAPVVAPATQQAPPTNPRSAPASRYQPLANKGVRLSSLEDLTNDTVGSFFSNVFGGNGSNTSASNGAQSGTSNTAVSAWSSGQNAGGSNSGSPPRAMPSTTASIGGASGGYRLQVADVRSRAVAERLANELRYKHAAYIGGRLPRISEKVYGNMGTFYQVSVGPYASQSETSPICAVIKSDGYDCVLVKN